MNKKEIYCQGHIVTVTRRFLDKVSGRMRVRVRISTMAGEVKLNDYRDFDDMHTGDRAFSKQIERYERMAQVQAKSK